jgi:hypothetical protein
MFTNIHTQARQSVTLWLMCPILLGLPQVNLTDTNRLSLSVTNTHVPRHGTKYAVIFFNNVGTDFPLILFI